MRATALAAALIVAGTCSADAHFVPATPIAEDPPVYPRAALMHRREGWVILSYVIGRDGSVTDVTVKASSSRIFEASARRAVAGFEYEPATVDGEPVESSRHQYRITFMIENIAKRVGTAFQRRSQEAMRLISAGDLEAADGVLARLENRRRQNLSEEAWLWWMRVVFHDAAGNPHEYHESLLNALHFADTDYLPDDVFATALGMLYRDHVERENLALAMQTWRRIDEDARSAGLAEELREHAQQLQRTIEGAQVLVSFGLIREEYPWSHPLTRRTFEFHRIDGRITGLTMRCDAHAESRPFRPSASWTVPDSWGECRLLVSGDADTTFVLAEYHH